MYIPDDVAADFVDFLLKSVRDLQTKIDALQTKMDDLVNENNKLKKMNNSQVKIHISGYDGFSRLTHLITLDQFNTIKALVKKNNNIEAIKELRLITNWGLLPAKDAIQSYPFQDNKDENQNK